MKALTVLLAGITGVGLLTIGSYPVDAQNTVDLPQIVLTAKHRETVTVPGANSTTQLVAVRSSNPGVATAQPFRNNQVEIVAVAPGKTTVEFFDRARGRGYRQPVWVQAANATGGGGAGYDPGKTQLEQIVMRIKHTENVTVPRPGPHQLSSVVSSNPSVATARTNTANTIQVYAKAFGDTWIDFRDNATGTTYQVHVWVTNSGALPPASPAPATTQPQPQNATAADTDLFNNFNTGGVVNGPRTATRFTLDRPATITTLVTYHWNNGRGAVPGTISLRDQNGKIYGPFTAIGSSGQGGTANVDWTARANVTVPAGTYAVLDSNPATWSHNAQSGFSGFAKVQGRTQVGGSTNVNLNRSESPVNDSVSENLLVNGDAEAGTGANDGSVVTVPGWQTSGFFTVMRYDGRSDELLSTSPGPSDRGHNFFLGGNQGESSSATQRVSVSRFAQAIDSGRAEFRLSGWLGGWETQNDQATLTVTFTDARGARLGTSSIGPVTNTDRQNVASLLERSDSGKVPAGTRWIDVELRMVRAVGTWNDGFADNLSLTIATR